MTVSIKQEDNLAYAYVYDYASEVKIDTVVIIWRAEDVERADLVHDIVQKQMTHGDAAELQTTVRHISSFGMAGCIFLAYDEHGMDRLGTLIVDNLTAELPCETELWLGTADDALPPCCWRTKTSGRR